MTLAVTDKTDEATRAAADGQLALNAGDTARAGACFAEAGKILEARIANARKQADKHYLRFLAASQYYRGGRYTKAQLLCQKIQADLLPPDVRLLFEKFRKDVEFRSRDQYVVEVRKQIERHNQRNENQPILEILQDHPYVLRPADMAFMRAMCCEELGDYHAAALFFADAWRMKPPDLTRLMSMTAFAWELIGKGKLSDAALCLNYQLEHVPHAITYATASVLRSSQADRASNEEERTKLTEEQLRYFEEALRRYQILPAHERDNDELRGVMTLCFEAATLDARQHFGIDRALKIANMAIEFNPSSPRPRTLRGIITNPARESFEDFLEAVRLGETKYHPFYYLACQTLSQGDFSAAISWCERALKHNPDASTQAEILNMLAAAKANLSCPKDSVHFHQAPAHSVRPLEKFDSMKPAKNVRRAQISRMLEPVA